MIVVINIYHFSPMIRVRKVLYFSFSVTTEVRDR
jgi:hypothetical protein